MFVDGYQKLKTMGVLDVFIEAHRGTKAIHPTSQNFFWHAYWLWELENAFRRLGEDYNCFALPYWDVTVDGEQWLSRETDAVDLPIYNSNLGGDGDIDHDMCVGGLWAKEFYVTDQLCADDEEEDNCCLKRLHVTSNDSRLFSRADFTAAAISTEYERFSDFQSRIIVMHGDIHRFVGSVPYTHFYVNDGSSNETGVSDPSSEPLFVLFHSFLDLVRLLRTDCWNFDKVALLDLEQYMNASYENVNASLDYEMDFNQICTEIDSFCANHTVTPRLMYDVSPNTRWNVIYELGGFWNDNTELIAQCADDLNDSWWADTMMEGDIVAVFDVDALSINNNPMTYLSSLSSVVITMVILAAILVPWSLYNLIRNVVGEKAQCDYQRVV